MATDDAGLPRIKIDGVPPVDTLGDFLKLLGRYKEVIAIIVFFGGGALWVFGYFATKTQVAELKCFAKNSIIVNRETMKLRDADEVLLKRSEALDDLIQREKSGSITDAQRAELSRAKRDVEKLNASRAKTNSRLEAAQGKLEDSECMGVEK